jgi:erythromycin esterase-like protein
MQSIQPINDYILTGEGDLVEILIQTGNPNLNSHELVELLEWIRSYNQQAGDQRNVEVVGFIDITPDYPLSALIEFLSSVDPQKIDDVNDKLSCFTRFSPHWFMYMDLDHEEKSECANSVREVHASLVENRNTYVTASS